MSNYTPGPWKVVTSWYDYSVEGPNGEEIIWQDGPYQTPTLKLSDARLIAAAPEMFELITDLSQAYDDHQSGHELAARLYDLRCMALRLLATMEEGK